MWVFVGQMVELFQFGMWFECVEGGGKLRLLVLSGLVGQVVFVFEGFYVFEIGVWYDQGQVGVVVLCYVDYLCQVEMVVVDDGCVFGVVVVIVFWIDCFGQLFFDFGVEFGLVVGMYNEVVQCCEQVVVGE